MISIIKNCILLLIFLLLKLFLRYFPTKSRENKTKKNLLFINTGKIGDVIVSSIILENDTLLSEQYNVWLLVCQPYQDLLHTYSGPINIISVNWKKYRYSLPYKLKTLIKLRNVYFDECYNLSPARGMLTDEISLLSGARSIYTTCNDLTYLGNFLGSFMNRYYDKLLCTHLSNEYQKHFYILKLITGQEQIYYNNNRIFAKQNNSLSPFKKPYILISPLSTDKRRNWDIDNYKQLCNLLSKKFLVVLTGNIKELSILKKIVEDKNDNIIADTSDLIDVIRLIRNATLFIGGNSGLTHIALKLGLPLVSILDGAFYGMYLPYYPDNVHPVYIYHVMNCFGCKLRCIYPEELCLTTISVSEVYETVSQILSQTND